MLLLNILLALAWAALTGEYTVPNFLFGFGLGYVGLWLIRRHMGGTTYFLKFPRAVSFLLFFVRELILANIRVAVSVLLPNAHLRPAVIVVPLDLRSDIEITLLAGLITLTPGSLSLDVSDDRRALYVHTIHFHDPESFRREIKGGFERRVKELIV